MNSAGHTGVVPGPASPHGASSDAVRHRWLDVGGLALHSLAWGPPVDAAPPGTSVGGVAPVVCLHGVTSCAWVWHHVARDLAAHRPVIAADLRGHGASSWSAAGAYRTVDHAGDVTALIEALGGGPVDLVGSSWGALVALAVAAERPGAVRRLALVDIEPASAASSSDVPPRPAWPDLAAASAWWAAANPHAPPDLVDIVAAGASRPDRAGGLVPACDPYFARRWPFRDEDWWDALDRVSAPTLVVSAGSSWVRPEVCDDMAARLPDGSRLHLERSTHVVPVDAPAPLAAALGDVLGPGSSAHPQRG